MIFSHSAVTQYLQKYSVFRRVFRLNRAALCVDSVLTELLKDIEFKKTKTFYMKL
jgi:hypothetical protein